MKKLLALILIFAFVMPAAVGEEIPAAARPFLGGWYAWMVATEAPNRSAFGDLTKMLLVITFEENGDITMTELDFTGSQIAQYGGTVAGSWVINADGKMITRIIGTGESEALIQDGLLYASLYDTSVLYAFHPFQPLDWYTGIRRR